MALAVYSGARTKVPYYLTRVRLTPIGTAAGFRWCYRNGTFFPVGVSFRTLLSRRMRQGLTFGLSQKIAIERCQDDKNIAISWLGG